MATFEVERSLNPGQEDDDGELSFSGVRHAVELQLSAATVQHMCSLLVFRLLPLSTVTAKNCWWGLSIR